MTAFDFSGQVAVVAGAGRGLGRVWALALAAQGAQVVLAGRDPELIRESAVLQEVRAAGGEAWAIVADVAEASAMRRLAAEVLDRHGRADILVCNAGIARDRSFAKTEPEALRAAVDVNLMGAIHAVSAFWPSMLERRYGRAVLLTSAAGLAGNFGQAGYGASKMALVGLMQTLGLEGEPKGVHVNCFAPIGATEMNAGILPPEIAARFSPERLIPGLLLLASKAAPNRTILTGGGGAFGLAEIRFTPSFVADSPEALQKGLADLAAAEARRPQSAMDQLEQEIAALGLNFGARL